MSQNTLATPGPLRLMVIIASTRPGRIGPAVAEWFIDTTLAGADRPGITVDVADLAEIGLPFLDEPEHPSSGIYTQEHTRRWSRRVAAVEAVLVVAPEYNYGMPAALKNAFDFLHDEWAWKPIGFISYGNTSAGTRSVQIAKQVATTLRMVPIGATVALRIRDSVPEGVVRTSEVLEQSARAVLAELIRVAAALRPLQVQDARGEPAAPDAAASHPPVPGLTLSGLREADLAELFVLQRCCWVQEAITNDTLAIPALQETPADLRAWATTWQGWVVRRHGRLIGAVCARPEGARWEIGRLMVAPDMAGLGIGRWLLGFAESQAVPGTTMYTLVTGSRSSRNIGIYQRAGYRFDGTLPAPHGAVRLSKPVGDHAAVDGVAAATGAVR